MAVDPKIEELINADIDGELATDDRERLMAHLAENPAAEKLHKELSALCEQLDSVQALEPPPHLRHAIMDSLPRGKAAQEPSQSSWRMLLAAPVFRHATAFAAGVVLTLALMSSNQISDRAFEDVTGLVGTIAEDDGAAANYKTIRLTHSALAGTVSIHNSGSLTVLDFNLTAAGLVEIVADMPDQDLWFRGFAQLENDNATVSSDDGSVKMQMQGKNRYAMYLHNSSFADAAVNLRFYAAGDLVHEAKLTIDGLTGKSD